MVDHLSREQRSENMRAVRSKNTAPEMMARKAAHRLGLRFRLHRSDLPGSPDFVLPKHRTAFFVHGCFWHGHGCSRSKLPQTNVEFWREKIRKNRVRDKRACRALQNSGWRVITLWQCELGSLTGTCSQLSILVAPARAAIIDSRPLPVPISRTRACRPSFSSARRIARSNASFRAVSFSIRGCQNGTIVDSSRRS
ncbi:MAG: very short patch repair endonuclease [Xanthobacteraceae bacterium]|nr:very short patch repair endonuclease [Xanthobacteraceae bacterium]